MPSRTHEVCVGSTADLERFGSTDREEDRTAVCSVAVIASFGARASASAVPRKKKRADLHVFCCSAAERVKPTASSAKQLRSCLSFTVSTA